MSAEEDDYEQFRSALVLYGTETGTSQDLAYETSRVLERHYFVTDVDEIDNVSPQILSEYALVVFVLATTGQGDFPSNARKFWKILLLKRLTPTFLSGVDYAMVGLGDTSYPKFNLAARKLHKRLGQLGATSIIQPCEADEQGEDSTDGAFLTWLQLFKTKLHDAYPLPDGQQPIPDDQALSSKWTLEQAEVNGAVNGIGHAASPSVNATDLPFSVILEQNDRVTPTDHWQDVRFLKLRADQSHQYYPGDALAIRPQNMSEEVQELIDLMHWNDVADRQLKFKFNRETMKPTRLADPSISPYQTPTLRQLLTNNLDIKAIPRRSFFAAIANYTTDEMHRDRLREFTDPQYLDEYYDYATRPRRSILEILQEFDSVKIPWQELINVFPILRPRQFSIASGGVLKNGGCTFELLVAIVKYRTVIKRIREGICTRYLAKLPAGSTFEVVLKTEGRFHKPEQLQMSRHLLVGAGTGIAPLRGVIYEKSDSASSPSTLIFGCRNAKSDYFFEDEWANMKSETAMKTSELQVLTAFSRDQKQKFYVQDRIRGSPSLILDHLFDSNSTVIICGSSGAMPKAIRQAFVDVLCADSQNEAYGKMNTQEAETFIAKMEKEGRYKQETW